VIPRSEVREYITTFSKQLITPLPGTTVSGWLNDLVRMVGISFTF
jgi:hypothetical protein